MNSGIYAIVNKTNGHRYIGSASNLDKRQRQHFRNLKNQCHPNDHLQSAWNKFGGDNFEFVTIFPCAEDDLLSYEQKYLDERPEYNLSFIAGKIEMTEDVKSKISLGNIGKPHGKKGPFSDEHKKNMSIALVARMASEEERERVRERNRTRVWSEESRQKASIAQVGKTCSAETKKKISATLTGRKFSDESRKRMSEAQRGNAKAVGHKNALGYKHTDETKKKISQSLIGNKRAQKGNKND